MKLLPNLVAFAVAAAVGACKHPETEACEDFVAASQACSLMNNDPDSELDDLCDSVPVECKEYYSCAAASECKESGGVYRLDSMACTMPEGKECLPSS
ncbi:MAG: hypothetical protein JNL82_10730 [Myxococcales bacterium]|nr:hypothetical protein [Myxococcales bacterium]